MQVGIPHLQPFQADHTAVEATPGSLYQFVTTQVSPYVKISVQTIAVTATLYLPLVLLSRGLGFHAFSDAMAGLVPASLRPFAMRATFALSFIEAHGLISLFPVIKHIAAGCGHIAAQVREVFGEAALFGGYAGILAMTAFWTAFMPELGQPVREVITFAAWVAVLRTTPFKLGNLG